MEGTNEQKKEVIVTKKSTTLQVNNFKNFRGQRE